MRLGDYCKPREEDRCDCDSRGTVPNTQCDPNTLQCRCKVNFHFLVFCFGGCGQIGVGTWDGSFCMLGEQNRCECGSCKLFLIHCV